MPSSRRAQIGGDGATVDGQIDAQITDDAGLSAAFKAVADAISIPANSQMDVDIMIQRDGAGTVSYIRAIYRNVPINKTAAQGG